MSCNNVYRWSDLGIVEYLRLLMQKIRCGSSKSGTHVVSLVDCLRSCLGWVCSITLSSTWRKREHARILVQYSRLGTMFHSLALRIRGRSTRMRRESEVNSDVVCQPDCNCNNLRHETLSSHYYNIIGHSQIRMGCKRRQINRTSVNQPVEE